MDAKVMRQRLEQWIPIFEEQARSGIGKEQWCRENGIRRWEFYRRQRECREYLIENAEAGQALPKMPESLPDFFELPTIANTTQISPPIYRQDADCQVGAIDVSYGGFDISLTGAVNSDTLSALIKAVKNA